MANEDINKAPVTPAPSAENSGSGTPQVPPVQDPKDNPQNIDFKKQADELENKGSKPKRSPQEEAVFNLKKNAERVKELGIDPSEALGLEPKEPAAPSNPSYVTKEDLDTKLAEQEVDKLTSDPDEKRVIMWRVRNQGLTVKEAHLLANQGRLQNTLEEMKRGAVKPPIGAGDTAGQKPRPQTTAELSREEHSLFVRRGYKLIKPGLYQAKFNQYRFDETSKGWVAEKIPSN